MLFENYYVCCRISPSELNDSCLYTNIIIPGDSVYPVMTYSLGGSVYCLNYEVQKSLELNPVRIRDILPVMLRRFDTELNESVMDGYAALIVTDDTLIFQKAPTPLQAKIICKRLIASVESLAGTPYREVRTRTSLLEL